LAEELRRRRGNREDIRTQVEREAEAGVKLQMQQQDFEWRQKYQVIITRSPHCRFYYPAEPTPCGLAFFSDLGRDTLLLQSGKLEGTRWAEVSHTLAIALALTVNDVVAEDKRWKKGDYLLELLSALTQ